MTRFQSATARILTAAGLIAVAPPLPAQTIGFVADGRPRLYGDGESKLTVDLNQLDDQMGAGWHLGAVLTLGDMDYIAEAGFQTFSDAYAGSEQNGLPLFYSAGNHELDNAYDAPVLRAAFAGYVDWDLLSGPINCRETTYSFETGDLHVVVINQYFDGSSDTGADGDIVDAAFNWLKNDLRASTKPYKIVCGHEPAYPEARHVGDSLDAHQVNRDRFWNLLQTEGVLAHYQGHTHVYKFREHEGVFEIDGGVCGAHAGSEGGDPFATLLYAHSDGINGFIMRSVNEGGSEWGGSPVVTDRRRSDLNYQILVNTAHGAGTIDTYYVDYTGSDQVNPDWSGNNGSRWWESAFNDQSAAWPSGELCVGFDTGGTWPWMNHPVSRLNGVHGVFERIGFDVYNRSGYLKMYLGVDYDDALIVWLNGTQIYASPNAPAVATDDIWDKGASSLHNASGDNQNNPVFTLLDVSGYLSSLAEGNNLLAVGNWNYLTTSSDLAAGIKLYLTNSLINEGFDHFNAGSRPSGWTFANCNADTDSYTGIGYFGDASPAVKLDATGDAVTTAAFSNPTSLSLWLRGVSTDAADALLVEEFSSSWTTVTNLTDLPAGGKILGEFALQTESTRLRFSYTKSAGALALDDVLVNGAPPAPSPTPTPTAAPSVTPTAIPPTPMPIATPTPTASATPTAMPSAAPTAITPSPSEAPPTPVPPSPTPWRLIVDADDYDGDGDTEFALWRASDGSFRVREITLAYYGLDGDIPAVGDYNGDSRADLAVFRPSTGQWFLRNPSGGSLWRASYGLNGDIPVPSDYDGDFRSDTAVWRPGSGGWFVRGLTRMYYGLSGDVPAPGDYNGDGTAEASVFRGTGGYGAWFVRNLTRVYYGLAGDRPVPGDYNGDGTTRFAVFRPSSGRWYIRGEAYVSFGTSADIPFPLDFDGDGTAERAVYRPSSGRWYIYNLTWVAFGQQTDQPLAGKPY